MTITEKTKYNYEEKENLRTDGKKDITYSIVKKEATEKDHKKLAEKRESLILFEGIYPIKRIPLFKKKKYLKHINNYEKFPYVLEFLDYVISKKAKQNNYELNKTPEYTEKELYELLQEYLLKKQREIKEKDKFISVIKKLILKKEKVNESDSD